MVAFLASIKSSTTGRDENDVRVARGLPRVAGAARNCLVLVFENKSVSVIRVSRRQVRVRKLKAIFASPAVIGGGGTEKSRENNVRREEHVCALQYCTVSGWRTVDG